MDIKKLSDEKLIEEFKCYWDMINTTCCHSCKDILIFDALEGEINKRGFLITNNVEVITPD